MNTSSKCRSCGSSDLIWFILRNTGGAQGEPLRMPEIAYDFILGCKECSETLRVLRAEDVAEYLTLLRTLPAQERAQSAAVSGAQAAQSASDDVFEEGHDEICQFHATNRKQGQSSHVSVSRELLEKVCDPKSSTNRQEGRKSIRTLLKRREPSGQYNHKRIGWELERTALGDGYYGNALRVAKDIPGLTDQDRAVLDRYATGAQQGTDHIALQDIAMRVYAAQGEGGDQ